MTTLAKAIAAAVLVAGSLAACADLPFRLPGERAAILKPEQGSILFRTDTVGNHPAQRVLYSDNDQRVEYALYKGKGAQAEFIYMERPYVEKVAFNYAYTVADTVRRWNYSKGQPTDWDKAVGIRTTVGDLFYRSYRLTARNQNCFGINGEWDRAVDDPRQRNTRIMFGYYCAPAGQALSQEKTLALIDAIGLKGITERSLDYADTIYGFHKDVVANFAGKEGTQKAIALAQFGADAAAGIAEYPFRFAEHYMISDGNNDMQ
ncbi:MAG TPA: hypothetical protein VF987_06590 [Rhodospirillales bacterium]|jgi:hypothetical protein